MHINGRDLFFLHNVAADAFHTRFEFEYTNGSSEPETRTIIGVLAGENGEDDQGRIKHA